MNSDCKYYDQYYDHVLDRKKTEGALGKVFDIIEDISINVRFIISYTKVVRDRRGIKHEFNKIDADIQEEIIEKWVKIIEL